MSLDIEDFNRRWLQAWSDADVETLLTFYAKDTVYKDPQTAAGITGHEALRAYLTGLFAVLPPTRYVPHEVWRTPNGYCGRWYATSSQPDRSKTYMRGFDLVVLDGDQITWNEVYVHPLEALPK